MGCYFAIILIRKGKQTNMNKTNKYKVNIYLGKENYLKYEKMAQDMGVPISTLIRVLLETGTILGTMLERSNKI